MTDTTAGSAKNTGETAGAAGAGNTGEGAGAASTIGAAGAAGSAAGSNDKSLKTQLTRFIFVGIFTAILDYSVTMVLTSLGLHRSAAKAIGWVFGTIAAYLVNARWTFGAQVSGKTAVSVGLLYASTFFVQNVLYWLLNAPLMALGFDGLVKNTIAFVIAQGVATVTNFFIQRMFVFKER